MATESTTAAAAAGVGRESEAEAEANRISPSSPDLTAPNAPLQGDGSASTTSSASSSTQPADLVSDAAASTSAAPEPQVTASSTSNTEASDSTAAATAANPTPNSGTTASMLPRASTVSTGSTSSSGTATPIVRVIPGRGLIPASVSNRSLSGNTSRSTEAAHRAYHRPNSQAAANRERPASASVSRANTAASAMASVYTSNNVPSIFGFYSHDGNPTTQVNTTNASTYQPPVNDWRTAARGPVVQSRHGTNSPGPARSAQALLHSPISSPRTGALSFYAPAAQRHHARAPSGSTAAHRSEQRRQACSTDTNLLSSALPAEQPTFEETTTISFTWTIRDLHLLREEVEHSPPPSEGGRSVSAGAGKSDVWTSHPVFGDNKWKLELVRTTRPLTNQAPDAPSGAHNAADAHEVTAASTSSVDPVAVQGTDPEVTSARSSITILSVYLTALVLDYTHADVEIPASIMVGLRPTRAAVGRSGAESGGYLWRRFYDYTFQKEADLFTCHDLPSVSEMLEDTNVARDDAVTLSIQLGLGPGHMRGRSGQLDDAASARAPIEVEGHHLVPRAVLNSLQGLLDDANTGDVRILVRERGVLLPDTTAGATMSGDGHFDESTVGGAGRIVPFPIGSSLPVSSGQESDAGEATSFEDDPDRIFVRDRVLWAHASVLKSRSDYFKTMLTSDFSEGISQSYGASETGLSPGRNVRTLHISDADFVTAYWFLRYLYTDDIQFADQEDVRSAVLDEEWAKGSDQGYLTSGSANGDSNHAGGMRQSMLTSWTPLSQLKDYDDFEELSYTMPAGTAASSQRDLSGSFVVQGSSLQGSASTSNAATTSGSLRQRTSAAASANNAGPSGSGVGSGRPLSAPNSPSPTSGAAKHHTAEEGPRVGSGVHRTVSNASAVRASGTIDPHDHPCAHPGPASALSIYKLAHRYHMQDLSRLAALHMVATLTPQSAFALLLASSMYDELHTRIKTYVYQSWHLVSHTQEFERCCDEVSVGMWGADAGKTMRAFVRSLVSPLRAAQS